MKPNRIATLMVVLIISAAPLVACAQASPVDGAPIVPIKMAYSPNEVVSKPSAQFAIDRINTSADGYYQSLIVQAIQNMPWEMLMHAARTIMPDHNVQVIIELPAAAPVSTAHGVSRNEQPVPPLFFALLSVPDTGRAPIGPSSGTIEGDRIIRGPDLFPMSAPALRGVGLAPTRGPRK